MAKTYKNNDQFNYLNSIKDLKLTLKIPSKIQQLLILVSILSIVGITVVASAITTRTSSQDSGFLNEFYGQMIGGFLLGIFGSYLVVRLIILLLGF